MEGGIPLTCPYRRGQVLTRERECCGKYAGPVETSRLGLAEFAKETAERLRIFFKLYQLPARLSNFQRATIHVYTQPNIFGEGRAKPRTLGVGAPPRGGATALDLWNGGVLRVGGYKTPASTRAQSGPAQSTSANSVASSLSQQTPVATTVGAAANAANALASFGGPKRAGPVLRDLALLIVDNARIHSAAESEKSASSSDSDEPVAAEKSASSEEEVTGKKPRVKRPATAKKPELGGGQAMQDGLFSYAHAAERLVLFRLRPEGWARRLRQQARDASREFRKHSAQPSELRSAPQGAAGDLSASSLLNE